MSSEGSPAAEGYHWPAEWAPHAATWLTWPHNRDTWPGKFERIPDAYLQLLRAVARFEPVRLLCPVGSRARLQPPLAGLDVSLCELPTNDSWIRDYGPTFLCHESAEPALIDWRYNAWGGKYPPYDLDDAAAARIAELNSRRRFAGPLTLEGGALEGNGRGLLITTRSSLLDQRRNPGLSRQQVEAALAEMLGVQRVLWLPGEGLAGDDTDGHIDQLARFVAPTTVVVAVTDHVRDTNRQALQRNYELLQAAVAELPEELGAAGRDWRVVRLPTPAPRWCHGRRLPCSYCNFIFVNGGLVVPQFDDPADAAALQILSQLLPGRQVVGVPAVDLAWGLGAFHCLSQHEPVPTLAPEADLHASKPDG